MWSGWSSIVQDPGYVDGGTQLSERPDAQHLRSERWSTIHAFRWSNAMMHLDEVAWTTEMCLILM